MFISETDKQVHYDRLHHIQRRDWLSETAPVWSCGTPVLPSEKHKMLAKSIWYIDHPADAYRSVDLNDAKQLADLDEYERQIATNKALNGG